MKLQKRLLGAVFFVLLACLRVIPVWAQDGQKPVQELRQTDAGLDRITLQWKQGKGAEYYKIYVTSSGKEEWQTAKTILASEKETLSTDVFLSGDPAGRKYDVAVAPFDENGEAMEETSLEGCKTLPGAVEGLIQRSDRSQGRMKLYWDKPGIAEGYQILSYNCKTRVQKTYQVSREYAGVPMADGCFYRVRIRPFIRLEGVSKALYGPYRTLYTAQQPPVSFKWAAQGKVRASWKPVIGATSYTVYLSQNQTSGYRKLKSLKGTSYTIPKLKSNTRYYVYVIANKTTGGVSYHSPRSYTYPFRIKTS